MPPHSLSCRHGVGMLTKSVLLRVSPSTQHHHPQPGEARHTLCLSPHDPGSPLRKLTLKSIMMSCSWNLLSRSSCRETGLTSGRTENGNLRPQPGRLTLRLSKLSLKKRATCQYVSVYLFWTLSAQGQISSPSFPPYPDTFNTYWMQFCSQDQFLPKAHPLRLSGAEQKHPSLFQAPLNL